MTWLIYDLTTGKIDSQYNGPVEFLDLNTPVGKGSIEGDESDKTYFIDVSVTPHAVTSKLEMSITLNQTDFNADLVDSIMITGLPNPVDVVWPVGVDAIITDSVAEFLTNTPSQYQISFSSIQYLEEVVNVTAHSV